MRAARVNASMNGIGRRPRGDQEVPRNDLPRSERLRRAHHPPRVAVLDWIVGRAKGKLGISCSKACFLEKNGKICSVGCVNVVQFTEQLGKAKCPLTSARSAGGPISTRLTLKLSIARQTMPSFLASSTLRCFIPALVAAPYSHRAS